MALSVQTNMAAITALKHLNNNNNLQGKAMERLSSGFRINSAADDAAGYAIASKLGAQGSRLQAASQNALQASAMVKMADASVNEIQNMFNRIQVLATQASSTNNSAESSKLDAERIKLESQINKIANGTNYNGVSLLNGTSGYSPSAATAATLSAKGVSLKVSDGSLVNTSDTYKLTTTVTGSSLSATLLDFTTGQTQTVTGTASATAGVKTNLNFSQLGFSASFNSTADTIVPATLATTSLTFTGSVSSFQVGSDNNSNNRVSVSLDNSYTTASLYSGYAGTATTDLLTTTNAQNYIDKSKAAIDKLTTQRADLGATQNQLGYVNSNLATQIEQISSSVSVIKDADVAKEMANFTKSKILVQAGTAMLAQANTAAQNVLSLFR